MASKIPYNMICECISGDETALKAVLKHYEPMIVELSKRTIRTGEDEAIQIVDEDIRAFIESELALAIIGKYDITRPPPNNTNPKTK